MRTETRPWGRFVVLYEDESTWLKELYIAPGQSLSLQYHRHRDEYWRAMDWGLKGEKAGVSYTLDPNKLFYVPARYTHRITNPCAVEIGLLEWAVGIPHEDDIVRLADNYGR